MTKRTNTKFFIVLGDSDKDGVLGPKDCLTAISRNMSYNFDAAYGFIFAKREAAEKMSRSYCWCNATVYSLQGTAYNIKKIKSHLQAKADAEKMFNA